MPYYWSAKHIVSFAAEWREREELSGGLVEEIVCGIFHLLLSPVFKVWFYYKEWGFPEYQNVGLFTVLNKTMPLTEH